MEGTMTQEQYLEVEDKAPWERYYREEDDWICRELDKSFNERHGIVEDDGPPSRAERIEQYLEAADRGDEVSGLRAWWLDTFCEGDATKDYSFYPCEASPAVFSFG